MMVADPSRREAWQGLESDKIVPPPSRAGDLFQGQPRGGDARRFPHCYPAPFRVRSC